MRKLACLSVMAVGLGLAGCMAPGGSTGGAGGSSPPPPKPLDSPVRRSGSEIESPNIPRAVNGLLAGVVLDRFDRKAPYASILVALVPEGKEKPPAPFDIQTNDQGYFTIPGLEPDQSYQLTARYKDGERLMAGSVLVRPPDPRVLIRVSEELVTPDTPPPLGPPGAAGTKPPAPEKKAPDKPAASLDRPVPPAATKPETRIGIPVPPPEQPAAPRPTIRKDLTINVNPPPAKKDPLALEESPSIPVVPPPPASAAPPVPTMPVPTTGTTAPPPTSLLRKAPVPSCVMLRANHVEDFALSDVSGQPWELRRDRKGRLVLLDFWHSQCTPCLRAIGHMNDLHADFSPHGLEVIGIACEPGPRAKWAQSVQSVRGRFDVKYRTLLWGNEGPGKPCPVYTQFDVAAVPTLKLIDETGAVVWQSVGLNERELYELRQEITRRLGLGRR